MSLDVSVSIDAPSRSTLEGFLALIRADAALASAPRGETLRRAKERRDFVTVLASGLCVAVKSTPEGQQQTVAIYVPGDIIDHEGFTLDVVRSTMIAVTPVSFFRLSNARLRAAVSDDPDLSAALCRYVAFQGVLAQEWMLSIGRRAAYERTAHLLCEIVHRMELAGMGEARACDFPLTQTELADILGLSVVHINRTLQRLRQDGYIVLSRGKLEIVRWSDLAHLANFDRSYLETSVGE